MKGEDSAITLGDVVYATCWGCGRWEELLRGLCWVCQAVDDLEELDWFRRRKRAAAAGRLSVGRRAMVPSTGPTTHRRDVAA